MSLKGGRELKARLRAIRQTFKLGGREWADEFVVVARPAVPVKSGRLRRSIRRRNANQRRATVVAHYTAYFIDKGTKAHDIVPRRARNLVFTGRGGRTIFAKRVHHPRTAAHPFRERAAREALRRKPMAGAMFRLWNQAA